MKIRYFLLVVSTLFSISSAFGQAALTGVVSEVPDGRTIVIRTENGSQYLIQIPYIETPTPEQSEDAALTNHLSYLLLGKAVSATIVGVDGQLNVGFVTLNNTDVGVQMVRDGAAWFWPEDPAATAPMNSELYRDSQQAAKEENRGLWAISGIVQPSKIREIAVASENPLNDIEVAKIARANLGSSVEGVFGNETYSPSAGDCSGKVVSVIDGDTVAIQTLGGRLARVRLEGIDAPEMEQAFGDQSKAHLSQMILGRTVQCTSKKTDRYGRSIGTISLDGVNVNLQMVRDCYAWHYVAYENEQSVADRTSFAAADSACKSQHRGLWSSGIAMPPWEFRKYQFLATYKPSNESYEAYNNSSSFYSGGSTSRSSGGPVFVRSYFRSNGTFVHSYTRSSPRR